MIVCLLLILSKFHFSKEECLWFYWIIAVRERSSLPKKKWNFVWILLWNGFFFSRENIKPKTVEIPFRKFHGKMNESNFKFGLFDWKYGRQEIWLMMPAFAFQIRFHIKSFSWQILFGKTIMLTLMILESNFVVDKGDYIHVDISNLLQSSAWKMKDCACGNVLSNTSTHCCFVLC